jgi:hypothetical protein
MLTTGRDRLGGPVDLDALLAYLQTTPVPSTARRIDWAN